MTAQRKTRVAKWTRTVGATVRVGAETFRVRYDERDDDCKVTVEPENAQLVAELSYAIERHGFSHGDDLRLALERGGFDFADLEEVTIHDRVPLDWVY